MIVMYEIVCAPVRIGALTVKCFIDQVFNTVVVSGYAMYVANRSLAFTFVT